MFTARWRHAVAQPPLPAGVQRGPPPGCSAEAVPPLGPDLRLVRGTQPAATGAALTPPYLKTGSLPLPPTPAPQGLAAPSRRPTPGRGGPPRIAAAPTNRLPFAAVRQPTICPPHSSPYTVGTGVPASPRPPPALGGGVCGGGPAWLPTPRLRG